MTDVKLPEPAAFTTQIKEGRVIFMARVSLNTQGLVGIFTSDQLRQAVQEAVEAERERCALVCEEERPTPPGPHCPWSDEQDARYDALTNCINAIRSGA
jgi:hypothetical protein